MSNWRQNCKYVMSTDRSKERKEFRVSSTAGAKPLEIIQDSTLSSSILMTTGLVAAWNVAWSARGTATGGAKGEIEGWLAVLVGRKGDGNALTGSCGDWRG